MRAKFKIEGRDLVIRVRLTAAQAKVQALRETVGIGLTGDADAESCLGEFISRYMFEQIQTDPRVVALEWAMFQGEAMDLDDATWPEIQAAARAEAVGEAEAAAVEAAIKCAAKVDWPGCLRACRRLGRMVDKREAAQ